MQGVPGSGKSTYAKKLVFNNPHTCVIVSADDFFGSTSEEYIKNFDPKKLSRAHGLCFYQFIAILRARFDTVIIDNTNTSAIEISPYILGAQAYGYKAEIHAMNTPLSVCLDRGNIHGCPNETVIKMYNRMITCEIPSWWTRKLVGYEPTCD